MILHIPKFILKQSKFCIFYSDEGVLEVGQYKHVNRAIPRIVVVYYLGHYIDYINKD